MRGKRSKQYRKLMHQYGLTFGFREPYQVLLDAQMVQESARCKMDLVGGLEKVLHGKVKPMISQCSMRHLYAAGDQSTIAPAKLFERRRCGHHELDEPLGALECIQSIVDPRDLHSNKHRYVGAIQDNQVRSHLRKIPGVPLIYINRSVMIMEPMAEATEDFKAREERAKFRAGLKMMAKEGVLGKRKRITVDSGGGYDDVQNELDSRPNDVPRRRRKKAIKGPNPLSVKKSTTRKRMESIATSNELAAGHDHKLTSRCEDLEANADPTHLASYNDGRKKRKRKPSNWKKAVVDKVLARGLEIRPEVG